MKKIFSLLSIILPITLFSQTHIPEGNVNGEWTSENSPYIIDGEISIQNEDLLTIEPGVEIIFSNHYKLNIFGRLLAEGTESDSIYFTAENTATGWYGLRFSNTDNNGQDSSKVVYCKLEYGKANGTGFYENMGGAIFCNYSSDVLIDHCSISDNSAEMGGGIFCYSSGPTIKNSVISNNTADYGGGMECYFFSDPEINDVVFINNSAINGGGIFFKNFSDALLDNVTIEQNEAEYGAGMYCYNSSPHIINSNILNNNAFHDGGGMQFSNNSNALLENLLVSGNTTQNNGGGIFCCGNSNITINNCEFTFNSAEEWYSGGGGGISIWGSSPELNNVEIIRNYASGGGGMECGYDSSPHLNNVLINRNNAECSGGGILIGNSTPYLSNVTISENYANWYSGGGISGWNYNIIFDPVNLCNIYLNRTFDGNNTGNDLHTYDDYIEVIVDTFTVLEPTEYHACPLENFSFDIRNQIFEPVYQDLYVSPEGSNNNSGLSYDEPLLSITRALEKIYGDSLNPVTIYLDEGIYSTSTTNEFFPLICKEHVTISGLFELAVILDGEESFQVIRCWNVNNVTLRNFLIRNGNSPNGGGISCINSNPRINHLIFYDNNANNGGGIYCRDSAPEIVNVTMYGNSAEYNGAGIYCAYNHSNPIVVNSVFWNNYPHNVVFESYGNDISITVAYSDFENGEESIEGYGNGMINWLEGNIDEYPGFNDPDNGNFFLPEYSPCIDAGTSYFEWQNEIIVNYDEGEFCGEAPEMGAYEYWTWNSEEDIDYPDLILRNSPNPFNSSTTIYFSPAKNQEEIEISIYNIKGQKVKRFSFDDRVRLLTDGRSSIEWNGKDENEKPVSSGIYFYQLQTEDYSKTRKMILMQ